MLCITASASAQKVVPIIWPFSPASSQATMIRATIDSANSQQNKYQFVFQNSPGAGGVIAANSAKEAKSLTILASTSSFYIRPLLYKNSHNVDDFNMISTLCVGQPLAIYSKKLNNLSDIQNKEMSIGVVPGSITTLLLRAMQRENQGMKFLEVPFKGTPEASHAMIGRHIDGSVDFIGTTVISRFDNDVKVLGITGKRNINGYPTFQSLKINGLESMTVDYYFFVNKTVDISVRQELHKILTDAVTEKPKSTCEDDFGQVVKHPYSHMNSIHKSNKYIWETLTAGIPKE